MFVAYQPPRDIQGLYRLGPALISGKFAPLYSAYDLSTGETVALLLARPPAAFELSKWQSLLEPLKVVQNVLHPHLLHLRDAGLEGNECFAATDLRGRTLREVMTTQALPVERALEIAWQVGYGASALHEQGVHGLDLRPDRIYLETSGRHDTALIADVGLRRFLWSLGYHKKDTVDDSLMRLDPRYAAPEQLQQRASGPATDIYALGLLVFEMVAARLPFAGTSAAETRALQLNAPVPNLTPLRGEALPELQTFIEQALAKHPSLRFSDMGALCDALELVQVRYRRSAPGSGRLSNKPPHYQTEPMKALRGGASTRPTPVPPSLSSLGSAALDMADEITHPLPSDDDEATLRTPGRARLLIGQSQRKKIIPMKRMPVILGRADPRQQIKPDIDLSPYDTKRSISRQHARIIHEGELFYIEDLQSVNKTWLGELELRPYERQLLRRHDRIQLGLLELIFEY